ncbi:hypothetical protein K469DRAFT_693900 [Zopfia rhizophila CBS 207.26]|uniref:Uncharacterized protein n=1 Tax=Zopfia rhizophila CBS 207.26 TaxID=1314779 RepID=A0A6A6DMP9_9PEZI|nr:hypothetical protein K469DRAFT_693900 [Zopfia rhizophila CBS 207.26]
MRVVSALISPSSILRPVSGGTREVLSCWINGANPTIHNSLPHYQSKGTQKPEKPGGRKGDPLPPPLNKVPDQAPPKHVPPPSKTEPPPQYSPTPDSVQPPPYRYPKSVLNPKTFQIPFKDEKYLSRHSPTNCANPNGRISHPNPRMFNYGIGSLCAFQVKHYADTPR